jgi:hypothetical protein
MATLVDRALIEQIEPLLDSTLPGEADCAGLYVEDPSSFAKQGREERLFGIPGAGSASLMGPLFVGIVALVAKRYLEKRTERGAVPALQAKLEGLAQKLSGKEPTLDRPPEAEGVAAISRSLVTSGWESGRAGETAAMLWNAGIAVGERLATSS